MSNPQRPLTPGERSARVQSRVFPGGGGGFISGVSPVRPRPIGSRVSGPAASGGGIRMFIQDDEPTEASTGDFWLDTDGVCGAPA